MAHVETNRFVWIALHVSLAVGLAGAGCGQAPVQTGDGGDAGNDGDTGSDVTPDVGPDGIPPDGCAPIASCPAEPPRAYVDSTYAPPSGSPITVSAGGDLQAALDAALPGQIVDLEAGAT